MASLITDYTSLQDNMKEWMNRADASLVDSIPTFIQLAEVNFMRIYAGQNNEVEKITDRTGEDPLTDTIPLEADYREMLTFTVDQKPLTRKSLTFIQTQQGSDSTGTRTGNPEIFARDLTNFVLFPFPSGGFIYRQTYYAKLLALSDANTSNPLLTAEPGMYLYGSLIEAEPFLRGEQGMTLVKEWKEKFGQIMAGVALERDEEDRSGSNVVVQNTFGSRGSSARTGWA